MATFSSTQGPSLELTVVGCTNLFDTEWLTKQDPYVCLEYGGLKWETRVCKDGSTNPTFQDKFTIALIHGCTEIDITVWNFHRIRRDQFISGGKASLHKAITQGYDDSSWPLQTRNGRNGGEVKLIMHYKVSESYSRRFSTHEGSIALQRQNPAKIEAVPSHAAPSGGNLRTATASDMPLPTDGGKPLRAMHTLH